MTNRNHAPRCLPSTDDPCRPGTVPKRFTPDAPPRQALVVYHREDRSYVRRLDGPPSLFRLIDCETGVELLGLDGKAHSKTDLDLMLAAKSLRRTIDLRLRAGLGSWAEGRRLELETVTVRSFPSRAEYHPRRRTRASNVRMIAQRS